MNMKEELEKAVEANAKRSTNATSSIEALQYTQACVNAMNALACLYQMK